ncbi:MAG TPA: hypothetical protein VNC78_08865 [Actinomycetota bacterium]|nr:hypothetical protein [Actinomycetota bacterium]
MSSESPTAAPKRATRNAIVVTVVLGAIALSLFGYAFVQRGAGAAFTERAVSVEADVVSATETRHRRNPAYTKAQVAFSTPAKVGPTFGEVIDCPEDRIPLEADTARILYDPEDVTDIRVPGCVDKDFKLFLALGGVFLLLDIMFVVGLAKGRRRSADLQQVAATADPNRTEPIVIEQDRGATTFIYGFIAVVCALAAVRGHMGAETTTGQIVGDVIFGGLALGSIILMIVMRRNPSMVSVGRDVITFSHRGAKNPIELHRTGDLYVGGTFIGTTGARTRFLKVQGSDAAIPLEIFDQQELNRACAAMGWRFTQP